jgi:Ig-like domain-containing protein
MQFKKLIWTSAVILLAAALASCNIGKAPEPTPDVSVIYTSAAQTMVSGLRQQQTQTAQAIPQATATPLASLTPLATFAISTGSVPFGTPFGTPFILGTPGTARPTLPSGTGLYSLPVGCNDATYIGETKPLDGTILAGGKVFDKGWSMQNTGTCKWDDGYSFSFKDGDQMQGEDVVIAKDKAEFTEPGHSQAFVIQMVAPKAPGEYKGYWQMKNDQGVWFGSIVYVDIVVGKKSEPTATATAHH